MLASEKLYLNLGCCGGHGFEIDHRFLRIEILNGGELGGSALYSGASSVPGDCVTFMIVLIVICRYVLRKGISQRYIYKVGRRRGDANPPRPSFVLQ